MTTDTAPFQPQLPATEIDDLLTELRELDLTIGFREELAVKQLLAEIVCGSSIESPQALRSVLAPVLARSSDERERFFRVFDRKFPPRRLPREHVEDPETRYGDGGVQEKTSTNRGRMWMWLALVVVCLAAAGAYWWGQSGQEVTAVAEIPTEPEAPESGDSAGPGDGPRPPMATEATAVPAHLVREMVDEILDAASQWSYAPSIDELAQVLAPHFGWAPDGLAIRIHELTGLGRYELLPIAGSQESVARLVAALWLIADPTFMPDRTTIERQVAGAFAERFANPPAVYAFANDWKGPGLSADEQLVVMIRPFDVPNNDASAKSAAGVLERALDSVIARPGVKVVRTLTADDEVGSHLQFIVDGKIEREKDEVLDVTISIIDAASATEFYSLPFRLRPKVTPELPAVFGETIGESLQQAGAKAALQNDDRLVDAARQFPSLKRASRDEIYRALELWRLRHDVVAPLSGAPWKPKTITNVLTHAPPWVRWLSAGMILSLTGFWLSQGMERRKAFLRRRAPKQALTIHELVAEQIRDTHSQKLVFARAARRLQAWTERDTDRIDIARTIEATLLSGRFLPVRTRAKSQPEYLFLIEAAVAGDQQAARLRTLVRYLEDRLRNVAIYYFSGTPAWCHPEDPKRGAEAPFAQPPQPIEELVARFASHRLVVLGTGEDFLNPDHDRPAPSVVSLANWPQRAMLTPLALDEWGPREFILARELDLPLGRATEEGVLSLAALLRLDGGEGELFSAGGDGMARSVPQIFRLGRIEWTLNELPSHTEWPQLCAALKRYLDPAGYLWFCACAVYPALRWDLILFLGVALKDGSGVSLYREDRLAALTALPWFREGRMPDWLRSKLIEEAGESADKIRGALRDLIKRSQSALDQDSEPIRFRFATEERGAITKAHDDEIFLEFLAQGRITDLEVNWLDALKALLPRAVHPWADATLVATAAIGIVLAIIVWLVAPSGAQVGAFDENNAHADVLPGGAWLPLLAALGSAIGVLTVVDAGPTRKLLSVGAPRVAMFVLASANLGLLFFSATVGVLASGLAQDAVRPVVVAFAVAAPPLAILVARAMFTQVEESLGISRDPVRWAIGLAAKSAGLGAVWAAVALAAPHASFTTDVGASIASLSMLTLFAAATAWALSDLVSKYARA